MAEKEPEEKKIIIDEDWKHEAQAEKEKLVREEDEQKLVSETKEAEAPDQKIPRGDFSGLVSMLTTQAFYAMGMLQVEGQTREPDLDMARYNIDLLQTLEEKSKGNLSDEEQTVLENTLGQLRMAFVKLSG